MKKLVAVLGLCMLVAGALSAQVDYADAIGDFTFRLPTDWTLRDFSGLKYKIAVGEVRDNFAQNINIGNEAFGGSMDEYLAATKDAIAKYFAEFRMLKEEAFTADGGLAGRKLVVEDLQQNTRVRQYFYFFSKDGMYYVVTCSVLATDKAEVEKTFDASMRTFRLLK